MSREAAIQSLKLLRSAVTRSKMTYEILVANGSDIHQFNNRFQTAQAVLQLLELKIDNMCSDECIKVALTRSRVIVYDFIIYVGEQIKYTVENEVVISEAEW